MENFLYLSVIVLVPILLGIIWFSWIRTSDLQLATWRRVLFFSGLCAATANFVLLWAWAFWLHFHYQTSSWRVQDRVSDVGLCLLFYTIATAIAGKGRNRVLLSISGLLAILSWIPIGVL